MSSSSAPSSREILRTWEYQVNTNNILISAIDNLRDLQTSKEREIKRLEEKQHDLNEIAYDPQVGSFETSEARVKRDLGVWPALKQARERRDGLPDEIKAKELDLIKAQDKIRELEPEIEKIVAARAANDAKRRAEGKTVWPCRPLSRPVIRKPATSISSTKVKADRVEKKTKSKKTAAKKTTAKQTAAKPTKRTVREKRERDEIVDEAPAPPRGRAKAVETKKGTKRARSPSLSPAPVSKKARKDVEESAGSKKAPGCKTSASKTARQGNVAPEAQMTRTAPASNTGTKRKAAFSVRDAEAAGAPASKRQKSAPAPEKKGKSGDEAAGKDAAVADSSEISNTSSAATGMDSTDATTPPSSGSSTAGKVNRPLGKPSSRSYLKGIKNIGNSCFSAVVLQLMDAALEDYDLDRLIGELGEIDPLDLTDNDCSTMQQIDGLGVSRETEQKLVKIRKAVKAHVYSKNRSSVSTAKHLRKLLEDLRADDGEKDISAVRFQTALALGGGSNLLREAMTGDQQSDASEYYTVLMDTLNKDSAMEDARSMKGLFEIWTEESIGCRECGHHSEPKMATSNQHVVHATQEADFDMAFEASKHSKLEGKACSKCGAYDLTKHVKFTKKPANLVVNVSRFNFNGKTGKATKTNTKLKYDSEKSDQHVLKIEEATYQLSAMIMHQGRTLHGGHYIVFRRLGDDWYKINDREVKKVEKKVVTDSRHEGSSAILLFKKQL